LNLKAHKFILNEQTYFELLDKASWHFEQPVNHPNTIGIYLLSKFAREHLTVLLSGEGADELLAGYERFANLTQNPLATKNFWAKLKQNIHHPLAYLNTSLGEEERIIMGNSFGSISNAFDIKNGFSVDKALQNRRKILHGLKGNLFDKQRKYELLTYLPDLLMRQDKMSMASSIENRVPFLDNDLVSLGLSLPQESLIRSHNSRLEGKFALKAICADKFDNSFAFRDKMGFGIPIRRFMGASAFEKRWNDEIFPGISKRGIFESKAIAIKFQQMKTGDPAAAELIWLMTSFEIWATQYLN
jgi:asparagine synthase (glutamine-hydrolysing)